MLVMLPELECHGTNQPLQVLAFVLPSWNSPALNWQTSPRKMYIWKLVKVLVAIGFPYIQYEHQNKVVIAFLNSGFVTFSPSFSDDKTLWKKHWFILLNWSQIEMQHSHRERMIRQIIFQPYNLQTYEKSFTSMFLTNSINRNSSCLTQVISLFWPLGLKIQLPNKMLTFIMPSKWRWSSFSKCSESPEYTKNKVFVQFKFRRLLVQIRWGQWKRIMEHGPKV